MKRPTSRSPDTQTMETFSLAESTPERVVFAESHGLRVAYGLAGLAFAAVCFGALVLSPERVSYGAAGMAAAALLGTVGLMIAALAAGGRGWIRADRTTRRLSLLLGLRKLSRRPRQIPFELVARLRLVEHPHVQRTTYTLLAEVEGASDVVLDYPFSATSGVAMGEDLARIVGCELEGRELGLMDRSQRRWCR